MWNDVVPPNWSSTLSDALLSTMLFKKLICAAEPPGMSSVTSEVRLSKLRMLSTLRPSANQNMHGLNIDLSKVVPGSAVGFSISFRLLQTIRDRWCGQP